MTCSTGTSPSIASRRATSIASPTWRSGPGTAAIALGQAYGDAAEFLSLKDYRHFNRWVDEVAARPAVQRGRRVNRKVENDPSFIRERHSAADLD